MLNRSARLAISPNVLKSLPGKLDVIDSKDTHLEFSIYIIMLQELTNGHMCRLMLPELTSSPGSKLKLLFSLDPFLVGNLSDP